MKKIALSLSVLAIAMGFTACENFELPNPPAQFNPQEAPVSVSDVVVAPATEATPTIELQAFNNANQLVPLGTIACENWPADYDMSVQMNLRMDGISSIAVPVTLDGEDMYAAADDMEAAMLSITKNPAQAAVEAYFSVIAVAKNTTSQFYIGGQDYQFGPLNMIVKPYDPEAVIEDTYYLVSGDTKVKLSHSDVNPYDDPMFTCMIEITEQQSMAGFQWQVVGESGTAFGGEGLTGDLTEGATGNISLSGPVMFNFNMAARTFEIFNAIEFVYTPGNANGWSQAASNALYTNNYNNYSGWAHLDGEWKFCASLDWSRPYGDGGAEGTLSTDGGAGNLNSPENGCYYLTMDMTGLTYTMTLMTSCGVIGDATPLGWDGQTNLTQDPNNVMVWTGRVHFSGNGNWKIRFNEDWAYNLGGDMMNLSEGGADMPTPGEGDFTVTLDLSTLPYQVTLQ